MRQGADPMHQYMRNSLLQSPSFQVSVAVGCATRDRTVAFASTFATFFTRAFDQIRMAAISESNINLCGSHCGVSIGKATLGLFIITFHPLSEKHLADKLMILCGGNQLGLFYHAAMYRKRSYLQFTFI